MGLGSLVFTSTGKVQSGWVVAWVAWNIEQGIEWSRLSLPSTHTASEFKGVWGETTTWCWGSCKPKAKYGGWSRGKWLSNRRCWINQPLSVYWLRPKCATSSNISWSLFIWSYHLRLIRHPKVRGSWWSNHTIATKQGVHQTFFQVMKICLLVALILCPIQIVWGGGVSDPVSSCCQCKC